MCVCVCMFGVCLYVCVCVCMCVYSISPCIITLSPSMFGHTTYTTDATPHILLLLSPAMAADATPHVLLLLSSAMTADAAIANT